MQGGVVPIGKKPYPWDVQRDEGRAIWDSMGESFPFYRVAGYLKKGEAQLLTQVAKRECAGVGVPGGTAQSEVEVYLLGILASCVPLASLPDLASGPQAPFSTIRCHAKSFRKHSRPTRVKKSHGAAYYSILPADALPLARR